MLTTALHASLTKEKEVFHRRFKAFMRQISLLPMIGVAGAASCFSKRTSAGLNQVKMVAMLKKWTIWNAPNIRN